MKVKHVQKDSFITSFSYFISSSVISIAMLLSFWASSPLFRVTHDLLHVLGWLVVQEFLKIIHASVGSARWLVSTALMLGLGGWGDEGSGVVAASADVGVFMLSDSWTGSSDSGVRSRSFQILSMPVLSWFLELMVFQFLRQRWRFLGLKAMMTLWSVFLIIKYQSSTVMTQPLMINVQKLLVYHADLLVWDAERLPVHKALDGCHLVQQNEVVVMDVEVDGIEVAD